MSSWRGPCGSFRLPYAASLSVGEVVQMMEQNDHTVKDAAVDTL